jgi:hypothetical protein
MLGSVAEPTSLKVGDRVVHYRDPDLRGRIAVVEPNRLSVMVAWDRVSDNPGEDDEELDFQWANKLVLEE